MYKLLVTLFLPFPSSKLPVRRPIVHDGFLFAYVVPQELGKWVVHI